MDAETRHHLKTNELADALKRIDFSDRRMWLWLAAIVIVALLYIGYRVRNWQSAKVSRQQWAALAEINTSGDVLGDAPLNQLRQLIAESSDGVFSSIAQLRLAEALRARAQNNDDADAGDAIELLIQIIASPSALPASRGAATYALGSAYESQRDFDKARELYTSLAEDEQFAGVPYKTMAATRLETLDELDQIVTMTPGIAPLPAPDTQPVATEPPVPPVATEPPVAPAVTEPLVPPADTQPAAVAPAPTTSQAAEPDQP